MNKKIELDEETKERINLFLKEIDLYALSHLRAAATIEFVLREAISSKLVNKINIDRLVGDNFSKIITLSYAMGVIDKKLYDSLESFRKIRNDIAHKVEPDIRLPRSL
jgi:hypothetical protein